jgi:hypothetical protein
MPDAIFLSFIISSIASVLLISFFAFDCRAPFSLTMPLSKQQFKRSPTPRRQHGIEFFRAHSVCLSAAAAGVLRTINSSRLRSRFLVVLPICAKLVALFSFLRIAEDFVRLVDILEFFLGSPVSLAFVGMILEGKLAICSLDFLWRGGLPNA